MRQSSARRLVAAFGLATFGIAAFGVSATILPPSARSGEEAAFPNLPLPPPIPGLSGFETLLPDGRQRYLPAIRRLASEHGLPAEIADAVVAIESAYQPDAVGSVGEIGLMQVLPSTATMLGYRGSPLGLFEPETNMRYGVTYLAQAWRLTSGDLCRTLMKYRAGHGEDMMTARSVDYCRRARAHLARLGSPLAKLSDLSFASAHAQEIVPPPAGLAGGREPGLRMHAALPARHTRTAEDSRRFWIAHERRIRAIKAKLAKRGFVFASKPET